MKQSVKDTQIIQVAEKALERHESYSRLSAMSTFNNRDYDYVIAVEENGKEVYYVLDYD